jgi:cation transport regulator ChaB
MGDGFMPYKHIDEKPDAVKNHLPRHAAALFARLREKKRRQAQETGIAFIYKLIS